MLNIINTVNYHVGDIFYTTLSVIRILSLSCRLQESITDSSGIERHLENDGCIYPLIQYGGNHNIWNIRIFFNSLTSVKVFTRMVSDNP